VVLSLKRSAGTTSPLHLPLPVLKYSSA